MTRRLTGIPRKRLPTHGRFETSARISQAIKRALVGHIDGAYLDDAQNEALEMIAFKMARIVSGDPNHLDHWNDIAGYAQLGARACKGRKR